MSAFLTASDIKQVEHLYNLVYHVLDMLAMKRCDTLHQWSRM